MKIDGKTLTIENVIEVSRFYKKVEIDFGAVSKVKKLRGIVEKISQNGENFYGINTGVGGLSHAILKADENLIFQEKLVKSHCVNYGSRISEEVVRAMMLIRANQLLTGHCGVRPVIIERIVDLLNHKITPLVHENGSVGASGDLAHLSSLALVLIGEGNVYYMDKIVSTREAFDDTGLVPIKLLQKEGLSIINGPSLIAAIGVFAIEEGMKLIEKSEIASAMTLEALKASVSGFDDRVQKLKGISGQIETAKNIRNLISGSELILNHHNSKQDAYSLRSIPQVIGSVREAWIFCKKMVDIELNSASDNPLIFEDDPQIVSNANFQGCHLAIGLETLGLAISTLCVLSERKINRLLNDKLSNGLPLFLTEKPGIDSGYMQIHCLVADLLVKNKVLSTPAANQSVSVSAGQEDYNSMGLTVARKTYEIIENSITKIGRAHV